MHDTAAMIKDKTILITGGTGFLGRTLVRELLPLEPKSIRVFSRDEVKHSLMQQEFQDSSLIRHLIGDVRDYQRLEKAMQGVDIVIHAAALKRLDIIEYNVDESIKTNILGTLNVVNACLACDVKIAVLISSDKACSPVNTYGAGKFVAERIFTESNYNKGFQKTLFTTVRYGNVLESTGSIIPLFLSRVRAGKPIPLTDERMTRFIISSREATKLIFTAILHAKGGEIFVPKLPSCKIIDLIDVIKDVNHSTLPITMIGLRPGEKIHELMINDTEMHRTYDFGDIYVITSLIDKYAVVDKPEYILKGKPVHMPEYSSADSLVPKDDVKKLLVRLGVDVKVA